MKIYVETNFVLELALAQEQEASCDNILRHCESGSAELVIPAYSLIEPYETLGRRHKQRKDIRVDLDEQLGQLARTIAFKEQLTRFREITGLLTDAAAVESDRLKQVRTRLLNTARIIPPGNSRLILCCPSSRHAWSLTSGRDCLRIRPR